MSTCIMIFDSPLNMNPVAESVDTTHFTQNCNDSSKKVVLKMLPIYKTTKTVGKIAAVVNNAVV